MDVITDSMDMSLSKLWGLVIDREVWQSAKLLRNKADGVSLVAHW